jgi:hypothetical protein
MLIGLDLDNTIISYDELFVKLLMEMGWGNFPEATTKSQVKRVLLTLPEGQLKWEQLQALAYGPRLKEACFFEGFQDFIRETHARKIGLCVVSHKSKFAAQDLNQQWNLHHSALFFLQTHKLLGEGRALQISDVHFAETREDKIKKISQLKCDVFIDDLKEVLIDSAFPTLTQKIWFAQHQSAQDLLVCGNWREMWALI